VCPAVQRLDIRDESFRSACRGYLSSGGTTNFVSRVSPGANVGPAYDVRLELGKRPRRDIHSRALSEVARRSEQQQHFHQAGVVPNEHHLVDLVGKGSDAGEQCFGAGRVEGDLDPPNRRRAAG
jgi:hypothetical protein